MDCSGIHIDADASKPIRSEAPSGARNVGRMVEGQTVGDQYDSDQIWHFSSATLS